MLTGKFRDRVRESSCIVHRRQDFESFAWRGLRVMIKNEKVVFHPVAWRDMHATRSLFQSDKVTEQDRREAGRYRALGFQACESRRALSLSELAPGGVPALFHHLIC